MTDLEIVLETIHKDKNSFALIIDRYERQILAYCARLLNYNQDDAQDVASQAFMKAYINLASYNHKLKFSSWLYRITHNEAINFIKKNSKHFSFDPQETEFEMISNVDFEKPISLKDLDFVLSGLNQTDRNLLILFYFEEKSIYEISEILKTTENSAKARLSQARKKAKEIASRI